MRLMVKMKLLAYKPSISQEGWPNLCCSGDLGFKNSFFVALKIYITLKFGCHQFVLILGFVFCFLYYIDMWSVYYMLLVYLVLLEKEMVAHSGILAWRILWTEEPGGLLLTGSHRVGHDWSDLACMHALEKEMATHSSVLARRIPGTEELGVLPSMGSQGRTRVKWFTAAAAFGFCLFLSTRTWAPL